MGAIVAQNSMAAPQNNYNNKNQELSASHPDPSLGTHIWYSKPRQKPVTQVVTGHRREATIIVLLNGCDDSIKLSFKCLCLHLLNTVSVNLNLSWKETSLFAVEGRCTEDSFSFHQAPEEKCALLQ